MNQKYSMVFLLLIIVGWACKKEAVKAEPVASKFFGKWMVKESVYSVNPGCPGVFRETSFEGTIIPWCYECSADSNVCNYNPAPKFCNDSSVMLVATPDTTRWLYPEIHGSVFLERVLDSLDYKVSIAAKTLITYQTGTTVHDGTISDNLDTLHIQYYYGGYGSVCGYSVTDIRQTWVRKK